MPRKVTLKIKKKKTVYQKVKNNSDKKNQKEHLEQFNSSKF